MAILVSTPDKCGIFVTSPATKPFRGIGFLFGLALICLLFTSALKAHAQKDNYSEYQVKAAFLYQFISFVDWPSDAFSDDNTPFVIGILGEDPFGDTLDKLTKGKKAHNHTISIIRSNKPEELNSCHIVFVSSSEQDNLQQILDTLSKGSSLTIGECDLFTENGGIIRFMIQKNKIVFEINNKNAQNAGLKISSQLLNLAQVRDEEEERSS